MQAEVKGTTMPLLEMILESGESVISTHGELSWMSANVQLTQTTSTGGQKGLMSGLKRAVGGGGLFLTKYEAQGGQGMVAFGAKLPGRIFAVAIAPGQGYLVHRHGWVCGTDGIVPTVGMQQTFRGGMYGGDGFILQRLEGQGQAWIELSGEITTYELAAGQSMLVHPGHVGLFEDRVSFTITRLPGHQEHGLRRRRVPPGVAHRAGQHLAPEHAGAGAGPGHRALPRPGDDHPAADAGIGGVLGGIIGKNL